MITKVFGKLCNFKKALEIYFDAVYLNHHNQKQYYFTGRTYAFYKQTMLTFVKKLKLPLFLITSPWNYSPNALDRPEITRLDRVMIH